MASMIVLSVGLRFWQEMKSIVQAESLRKLVRHETTVLRPQLKAVRDQLNEDGLRMIAVGYKRLPPQALATVRDESALIFSGFVAVLDPPKETTAEALRLLAAHARRAVARAESPLRCLPDRHPLGPHG